MADLFLCDDDDGDDGDGYGDGPMNPDDLLPPFMKLEKYVDSDNIFNRQMVARTILETLRTVVDVPSDVEAVLNVMNKLADDADPSVRAELMEQVPHIAMYCQEFKLRLSHVVPQYLLPMVVKFLTDSHNQARKTSQAALLVLLEQGLVEREDVQAQVCPVIIRLTEADSLDEYRTEAVALLSKMAPLIGKEMAESLFLERFAALCVDPLFHVRKVCAANFGDFSSVVGSESTELVLLPKFFYLCEDGVWGVRKACADVFMPVSCVCSAAVRQAELSPLFVNLLRDQSRWVRMAAFQALGPFISTFADSSITALLHNDNGEIVITDTEQLALRLEELEVERLKEREERKEEEKNSNINVMINEEDANTEPSPMELLDSSEDENKDTEEEEKETLSAEERRAKEYLKGEDNQQQQQQQRSATAAAAAATTSPSSEQEFNNFNFWREPLAPLELEEDHDTKEKSEKDSSSSSDDPSNMELFQPASTSSPSSSSSSEDSNKESSSNATTANISTFDPRWSTFSMSANSNTSGEYPTDPALPKGPPLTEQNIVPQLLIDHFVSMIDPSRAQTVDGDIARHCAFSLPAVALTLGRSNWPLLRDTYEALATDMQWKVRRTLASSIHELGVILGQETAGSDLIPIFNGLLKDLDEVRIGLLKHLADFIRLLNTEDRTEYLPKLAEFLKMDNNRNWRFRLELTEQLESLIPLFSPEEVKEHISPIAMVLVRDKVASVRQCAVGVVAGVMAALNHHQRREEEEEQEEEQQNNDGLAKALIAEAVDELACGDLWVQRQTYAALALEIYVCDVISTKQYALEVLPSLMELADDRVANVRLSVARTLSQLGRHTDEFHLPEVNVSSERLREIECNLKNDSDVDVRMFFGGSARAFTATAMTELDVDAEEEEEEEARRQASSMLNMHRSLNMLSGEESYEEAIGNNEEEH